MAWLSNYETPTSTTTNLCRAVRSKWSPRSRANSSKNTTTRQTTLSSKNLRSRRSFEKTTSMMSQTCQNPSRYFYLQTSCNLTQLMLLGTQAIPMTSAYCLANSSPAELPSYNTKSIKSWQDGRILPSTRTKLTKYQPSSTSPFQFSNKNKTVVWTVCLDWPLTTSTGMLTSQTDRRLLLQIKCRQLHLKRILSSCQTNEFVLERQGTIFRTKHCFTSRKKTFL